MANTVQAKKRSRQNIKRNQHCSAQRAKARTVVKKVNKSVFAAESSEKIDINNLQSLVKEAFKVLDSTADKGIIHKNKAARIKSRINAKTKQICLSLPQTA